MTASDIFIILLVLIFWILLLYVEYRLLRAVFRYVRRKIRGEQTEREYLDELNSKRGSRPNFYDKPKKKYPGFVVTFFPTAILTGIFSFFLDGWLQIIFIAFTIVWLFCFLRKMRKKVNAWTIRSARKHGMIGDLRKARGPKKRATKNSGNPITINITLHKVEKQPE
ncbi:MAG: hypothetical protein ILP23_06485 [Paludibacteraceae bacterium]|nr:hypothetical protein [Paludibacteraceae bacterium]MBP5136946.1 hypothetical protein [Paludibacteraceae bacterium]